MINLEFGIRMPKGVTICKLGPKAGSASSDTMQEKHLTSTQLGALLQQYSELFSEKPSTITGHKAVLHMKEGAIPSYLQHVLCPFQC